MYRGHEVLSTFKVGASDLIRRLSIVSNELLPTKGLFTFICSNLNFIR